MSDFLRIENRHTGEVLQFRRARDGEGQPFLLIHGSLPPKSSGPPPHAHFREREEGSVKAGTLGARVGNQKIVVPTGGSAAFPPGVVHSWWNAGNDLLEFSGRTTPVVDLDRFLQAIFAILNAGPSGRPDIFYLAHVLWRHRRTQSLESPPRIIQRIVFPLLVFLGRILGKYRGTAWPGSPESCPGAPFGC